MLLQIVRQGTEDEMHRLIDKITGEGITREEARRFNREEGRRPRKTKQLTFRFRPSDRIYQFSLTFSKPQVEREELIHALREILDNLVENPDALVSAHGTKLGANLPAGEPAVETGTQPHA